MRAVSGKSAEAQSAQRQDLRHPYADEYAQQARHEQQQHPGIGLLVARAGEVGQVHHEIDAVPERDLDELAQQVRQGVH